MGVKKTKHFYFVLILAKFGVLSDMGPPVPRCLYIVRPKNRTSSGDYRTKCMFLFFRYQMNKNYGKSSYFSYKPKFWVLMG